MELTYYDIRPPDASVLSKRGQLENSKSSVDHKATSKSNGANEPRHFGPREIRRRPLPPDPTAQTPSRPPMPEIHSSLIPHTQGYGSQETSSASWAPDRDFHVTDDPFDQGDSQIEDSPFNFELPRERVQPGSSQSDRYQNVRGSARSVDDYQTPQRDGYQTNGDFDERSSQFITPGAIHHGNLDLEERRHSAQPAFPSQSTQYSHPSSPYGSSPSARSSPTSNELRQRAQYNRFSTSPTKKDVFRDSPLKQSMSHTEFPLTYEEPQHMDEDGAPPPPPAHRTSANRGISPMGSHQDMQAVPMPEPLNIASSSVRTLPDVRSPLQNIERAFDPLLHNQAATTAPLPERNGGYVAYSKPTYTPDFTRSRGKSDASPLPMGSMPHSLRSGYHSTNDSIVENDIAPGQSQNSYPRDQTPLSQVSSSENRSPWIGRDNEIYEPDQPFSNHASDTGKLRNDHVPNFHDRDRDLYGTNRPDSISSRDREVYGDRHSSNNMTPSGINTRRPQSSQASNAYGGGFQRSPVDRRNSNEPYNSTRNGIPIHHPRTVSPDDRDIYKVPTRKSVSTSPAVEPSPSPERRLSGIPFSPDSYDILNPSTAPNSAATTPSHPHYETPEQAAEAARQREVEKLREVGPIIGNDGRVIDPSDHLPTDTWAPEPERKPKKPEVVIRFKTGNNNSSNSATPRTPQSAGGHTPSPRPQSMYGSSPGQTDTPSYSSNIRIGRNRLQKSNPSRPLPTQPYTAASSPAVPFSSAAASSPYHTPSPRNPARNSVSEYPLRENHNFGNSSPYGGGGGGSAGFRANGNGNGWTPPRPAKIPLSAEDAGMDALAREMQSIDIGVGSGGRGPRTRRLY